MTRVPKNAMVLAAGKGLRMRPHTDRLPKPLVEVAGRPLIDHAIDRLEAAGVIRVVVNTHHLGEMLEAHLAERTSPEILISPEADLLETGGGVKNALPLLGADPFLVVNSDAFWLNGATDALGRLADLWDAELMDAFLLLHSTVDAHGYDGRGDFMAEADGKLRRRPEGEVVPWMFGGIQILKPELFADAPDGAFSLNWIYDWALDHERLYGMVHDGEWFHVGSPDGLAVVEEFLDLRYTVTNRR